MAFRFGLIQQLYSTHFLFRPSQVQLLSKVHGFHLVSSISCDHIIIYGKVERKTGEETDRERNKQRQGYTHTQRQKDSDRERQPVNENVSPSTMGEKSQDSFFFLIFILFILKFCLFIYLFVTPHGLWDLSSLTRVGTQPP